MKKLFNTLLICIFLFIASSVAYGQVKYTSDSISFGADPDIIYADIYLFGSYQATDSIIIQYTNGVDPIILFEYKNSLLADGVGILHPQYYEKTFIFNSNLNPRNIKCMVVKIKRDTIIKSTPECIGVITDVLKNKAGQTAFQIIHHEGGKSIRNLSSEDLYCDFFSMNGQILFTQKTLYRYSELTLPQQHGILVIKDSDYKITAYQFI